MQESKYVYVTADKSIFRVVGIVGLTGRQAGRQAGKQAGRQASKQPGGRVGGQADRPSSVCTATVIYLLRKQRGGGEGGNGRSWYHEMVKQRVTGKAAA